MWLVTLSAYLIKLTVTSQTSNSTDVKDITCVKPIVKDQFLSSFVYNQTCSTCQFVINDDLDKIVHSCGDRFKQPRFAPLVHLMNASMFTNNNQENNKNQTGSERQEDWCMIVNFYAPYCPFSARLAPFYNALPRVFPSLFVAAVDATQNSK